LKYPITGTLIKLTESLVTIIWVIGRVLMSLWRKYIIIAPVSLILTLLAVGCSETKVSQCERLTKIVNQGTSLVQKNKGYQVTTSLKLAKDLEGVTKSLKEMNFKDPKLVDFQTSYVKVFETFSQEIGKAAKALGATKNAKASSSSWKAIQKDRGVIDASLTAATTAGKQSDQLEGDMKQYCSKPE
jgi:hypothetical protein